LRKILEILMILNHQNLDHHARQYEDPGNGGPPGNGNDYEDTFDPTSRSSQDGQEPREVRGPTSQAPLEPGFTSAELPKTFQLQQEEAFQ
jgi:hypothetical protein